MLWKALLLAMTMSGDLDVLWSIRVGNKGPMYLMMFLSISAVRLLPVVFVVE